MKTALKQITYVILIALGIFFATHYQLLVALGGPVGLVIAVLAALIVLLSVILLVMSFVKYGTTPKPNIT